MFSGRFTVLEPDVGKVPTKAKGFMSFLDYVNQEAAKPKKQEPRGVAELYLNGNSGFTRAEFYKLLERSRFVSRVIDIHVRDNTRLDQYREPGDESTRKVLEIDDTQWHNLVKTNLADWLYGIADIFIMQAKFASRGYAMSRVELASLLHDRFLGWKSKGLQLKDGRNEVWTAYTLRYAINEVLPEIKTSGAVTLVNVTKKINARSNQILYGRNRRPLSGKHLQKLLKKHHIDWARIKKSYQKRLHAGRNGSQSASIKVGKRE